MGKLIAGTLIAFFATLAFVAPAGAAQIPPTAECVAIFKKEMAAYVAKGGADASGKKKKALDRKFANNLAAAGCVTDPEPLIDWVQPTPYTEECAEASRAADRAWTPMTRRVNELTKRTNAKQRQLTKQSRKLSRQARQLRRAGAPVKKVRAKLRKSMRLSIQTIALAFGYLNRLFEVTEPGADSRTLVLFELISLRCVGEHGFTEALSGGSENRQPAAQAIRKHRMALSFSVLASMFSTQDSNSAGISSAGPRSILDLPLDTAVPGPGFDLDAIAAAIRTGS